MVESRAQYFYQSCLVKPSTRWRRRQLLCLFIIFIIVTIISSVLYTFQRKKLSSDSALSSPTPQMERCTITMLNMSSRGPIKADTDNIPSFADLKRNLSPFLTSGGHFSPESCRSEQKLAVIVPYRDRKIHLKLFLRHMHPFLQRQNLEYGIFVVEQEGPTPFNRAMLLNIGYVESTRLGDYNCFVFHDVDLLPLDDRNFYKCIDSPVHLSASIDAHNNKLMYNTIFGGASMLTGEMVEQVNGFSNLYFGWGGEDDDMSYRVRSHGMTIVRYVPEVARYTMLKHAKENKEDRTELLSTGRSRSRKDGLNSVKYGLVDLQLFPLYTWVFVRINQTQVMEAHRYHINKLRKQ